MFPSQGPRHQSHDCSTYRGCPRPFPGQAPPGSPEVCCPIGTRRAAGGLPVPATSGPAWAGWTGGRACRAPSGLVGVRFPRSTGCPGVSRSFLHRNNQSRLGPEVLHLVHPKPQKTSPGLPRKGRAWKTPGRPGGDLGNSQKLRTRRGWVVMAASFLRFSLISGPKQAGLSSLDSREQGLSYGGPKVHRSFRNCVGRRSTVLFK